MLLNISLHSSFSAAVVSPSLIAASTLEMEDLPIYISSLFAFSLFFLPFLTSVCFQEQREAGRVHPRAWLGAQGDSQRTGSRSPREQLASLCALIVLLCAWSLIIWS